MKPNPSRRAFLKTGAVSALATHLLLKPKSMNADPLNLPIGLQLYAVGREMDTDPVGTLKRVAAIGYQEVELSPLANLSAKDLRKALDDLGLNRSRPLPCRPWRRFGVDYRYLKTLRA